MVKKLFYHLIGKKTPEEKIRERIRIINELVQEKGREEGSESKIERIKNDFYLDGLVVADEDGEVLESNGGRDEFERVVKEPGLLEYINENLPETEVLKLRKEDQNHIIYNQEDKIYFMRTPGTVSTPEMQRIIQKVNGED